MKQKKKKTMTMPLLVLAYAFFVFWPVHFVNAGKAPSSVYINKCCRIGESLERNAECSIGGSDQWWPVIYMIMKKTYFQPLGEAPRFFKINESSRPECHSPELISGEHSVALFSNGTLLISDRYEFIDSENFCIDKNMALICSQKTQNENLINQIPNRTIVRKCCQPNEIYQSDCMTTRDGNKVANQKLIVNSTHSLEYRYGFPKCEKNIKSIAIVGKFNESEYDENSGNLTLAEGVFQSNQYCLEHFNDSGKINVHIFTCTEYLPISEKPEKVSEINVN